MATKKSRPKPPVFLDTSIFVKLTFGHSLLKREIRKTIGDRKIVSARYVFTEIRNQAIALIDIYFLFRDEATIADAVATISDDQRARFVKTALSVIGQVMEETAGKSQRLAAFENIIFAYVETAESLVSDFIDGGLGCPLAKIEFSREPGLSTLEIFGRFRTAFDCQIDSPVQCKSDEFRGSKARWINLVRTDELARSDGMKNLQKTLDKLASGKMPHARGLRYRCSKIGDLLIALQCPSKAEIVSLDAAFRDLGRVLERGVHIVPSLAALRKAKN